MRFTLPFAALLIAACTAPSAEHEAVRSSSEPIIGGIPDVWRSYVVGLGDSKGPECTGTVVSPRTVITAGHCYSGNKALGGLTHVYFGNAIDAGSNPVVVQTVAAIRDPQYNDNSLTHDLAIVKLATPAPTQPAPLLRETMTDAVFVGPNFAFVGYGNDGNFNYDLRRVTVFPIDAVGPANVGLNTGTGPIDKTMFFYELANKNTCDGDSGGPAFVARSHVERLAGTTSFGDFDCAVDGVNQRTDAPAIAAFIQPTIDDFEQGDECRANGVCNDACNVGQLVDVDCAEMHCPADGICVLSCVDPVDPDCTADFCGEDGACDPSCSTSDPDCGSSGTTSAASSSASSASSSSSTSTATTAATNGVSSGAGGTEGEGGAPDEVKTPRSSREDDGCGCAVPGAPTRTGAGFAFAALVAAWALHRRVSPGSRTARGARGSGTRARPRASRP